MTPDAEAALLALAVATCRAEHVVSPAEVNDGATALTCGLAAHHDGIVHYDPVDGVLWAAAQPGMTRDQAADVARRLAVAL